MIKFYKLSCCLFEMNHTLNTNTLLFKQSCLFEQYPFKKYNKIIAGLIAKTLTIITSFYLLFFNILIIIISFTAFSFLLELRCIGFAESDFDLFNWVVDFSTVVSGVVLCPEIAGLRYEIFASSWVPVVVAVVEDKGSLSW